jgi:hypothetical protein
MYLSKIVAFVITAFFGLAMPGHAEQAATFKMTDGYFQVGVSQPVHLTHQSSERHIIWLGDEFRLWVSVALDAGAQSPCTRRSKDTCSETLEVIGSKKTSKLVVRDGYRIDESVSISFSVPEAVTRPLDLGEAVIRFRISFKETILYQLDIPIMVK